MISRKVCLLQAASLLATVLVIAGYVPLAQAAPPEPQDAGWKKHVVMHGMHCSHAIAGDFTKDGLPDVISNVHGKTRLFVAPDWKEVILNAEPKLGFIHCEALDIDGDGDLDWVGAGGEPGRVVWLEQPANPLTDRWTLRLVDDKLEGIHGLLVGDVDRDGKLDLLANSGLPKGDIPNSLVWYTIPKNPAQAERWERHVLADKDASGLTHYLGFGDVNGDGRPDVSTAAKGGPQAVPGTGEWYAWWEAPADPTHPWKKHLISEHQPGATNIRPVDVNGDGKTDFIATRGHDRGVIWFEAPNWTLHVIDPTLKEPHCLVAVDLDGDGDIDAATCGYGDKRAAWYENDGKGQFKTHLLGNDQAAYDIRAVDMDRDGDLDILIAGQASQNIVWFENALKPAASKPAKK